MPRFFVQTDTRIEFLRFCRCKKWYDKPRLHHRQQRYRLMTISFTLIYTPFGSIIEKKEYCFFPIIEPKGVYIKCISIFISVVCGAILTCETIFCIYRISGIQFWHQRAQQNAALCFKTLFKTWSVSLLSVVQSRLVIPFFASTKSQEFNYGISARNRARDLICISVVCGAI